jgi:putative transposase
VLRDYVERYNKHRPHRSLHQRPPAQHNTPIDDDPMSSVEHVQRHDILGGLIHEYRTAA